MPHALSLTFDDGALSLTFDDGALSLTFDDGPDPTWTPQILRQLQSCQAAATFFMVGERVLAQPALARKCSLPDTTYSFTVTVTSAIPSSPK